MSDGKVINLREGMPALEAFMNVHASQRVPYESDEAEERFMSGRKRPYVGQAHTAHGARGQTEVRGITFRDINDAIVTELHRFRGKDPDGRWDDEALARCVSVLIEKMMGIYPNVAPLEPVPAPGCLPADPEAHLVECANCPERGHIRARHIDRAGVDTPEPCDEPGCPCLEFKALESPTPAGVKQDEP